MLMIMINNYNGHDNRMIKHKKLKIAAVMVVALVRASATQPPKRRRRRRRRRRRKTTVATTMNMRGTKKRRGWMRA